ncbi:WD40 repeat domain-containing protein [Candidatus Amarolinea dominans]|uniref:WD40 repeat domain-containing protein n=1 Tax=Candidatus Amarolinea dominans TaxID=3140696 RepID=UPI001DCAA2B2|nr:WD40 repeat domain-containing protein [Anaerolineae bacterium]
MLDQFEEYFLYHADEAGPGSFAHELVAILTTPDLRVNVLLALREDALARLDRFKGQIPFLLDNRLSIGHLGRAAGEEAIRKPLAQYNRDQGAAITLEPALVEAVLDQVGSGRVTLSKQGAGVRDSAQPQDGREQIEAPYLQLVLTRLWELEQANRSAALRSATLDSLGGAETIVRNYLDDTLAALDPADQALAASFFDRLVTPSGTKIALSLDEIAQYTGRDRGTVEDLLNRLQGRRLLRGVQSPGGVTQYEIFHDVLGQAMLDWQARYRRVQEEAARLAEEQAARAEAEQRANEAAARAQLEERARRVEQRSANRLRWLVGAIGLLLVAAIGLTMLALDARNDAQAQPAKAPKQQPARRKQEKANAERQRLRSRAGEMAARAQLLIAQDHHAGDQALLLARDAVRTTLQMTVTVPPLIDAALRTAVDNATWRMTLPSAQQRHQGAVNSAHFSPDGQTIVSAGDDGTVRVWRASDLAPLKMLVGHTDGVWSAAYSPDGKRIVSASDDQSVRIWDGETGALLRTLAGHTAGVWSAAYSPDGKRIVSASADQSVRIWDGETGALLATLAGHTAGVLSAAYSPDGKRIVSASNDGSVRIWDGETGALLATLAGHTDMVSSAAYSPDGQRIVSASDDGSVRIWDGETGALLATLAGHTAGVRSAAYSPDGNASSRPVTTRACAFGMARRVRCWLRWRATRPGSGPRRTARMANASSRPVPIGACAFGMARRVRCWLRRRATWPGSGPRRTARMANASSRPVGIGACAFGMARRVRGCARWRATRTGSGPRRTARMAVASSRPVTTAACAFGMARRVRCWLRWRATRTGSGPRRTARMANASSRPVTTAPCAFGMARRVRGCARWRATRPGLRGVQPGWRSHRLGQ